MRDLGLTHRRSVESSANQMGWEWLQDMLKNQAQFAKSPDNVLMLKKNPNVGIWGWTFYLSKNKPVKLSLEFY